MARETEAKLNRETIRQSLLAALKYNYSKLKKSQIMEIESTFIGDKGELCWLGDPSYTVRQIWDATEEYNRSRRRYEKYVGLTGSGATDEDLMRFLDGKEEI